MADRNLSVMAFMFLMEASSLVLTSSWDIACSGVTSYGSLLLRTRQKEKENMRPSSLSGASVDLEQQTSCKNKHG